MELGPMLSLEMKPIIGYGGPCPQDHWRQALANDRVYGNASFMKHNRYASLFAACVIALSLPEAAFAWGKTGHRVGADIAQDYLTKDAQDAIISILDVEGLPEASTWPDFMRSSPDEFWQGDSRSWHYVTIPKGETYGDSPAPEEGDAITALSGFKTILQDPLADPMEKARALRFAVHIIGDLHQPLHAGDGTDRGGNDFDVTWFGDRANLHRVWDTKIVDDSQLSYTEYADRLGGRVTPELASEWNTSDPVVWVTESAGLRDTIYPEEGDNLRWNYVFEHRADMELRLTQSGVRIAAWLNETFSG